MLAHYVWEKGFFKTKATGTMEKDIPKLERGISNIVLII
jgi:hypothetical protein